MPIVLYDWSSLTARVYGARGDAGVPPDDGNGRHWYEADYVESASWLIDATWSASGSGPYFPMEIGNDAGDVTGGHTDPVTGGLFRSAIEGLFGGTSGVYGRVHIPERIRSGTLEINHDDNATVYVNGTLVASTAGINVESASVSGAVWAARSSSDETILAFHWTQAFSPGAAHVDLRVYDVILVGDRRSFVRGGQMPNGNVRGGQYGHGSVRGGQQPR